ncbi:MAG: FHA domain-containing protein, partial [Flavisolibacter sp.]
MYIKVEVDENQPVYYRFTQNELTIGSSASNSIVINHKSISKKHAKLILDEGKWYVVDQGSTNGSYIEDDQLIPGKRIELGVDVPLRIGDYTFITFVEEASDPIDVNQVETSSVAASISSDSDRTRVINLADLQA